MQEIIVSEKEYGQRLDKLLTKYLSQAGTGFLYKMLRKKNITLNDKKATGKEILQTGDSVKIYFSDETLEKFRTPVKNIVSPKQKLDILYEDENILIINKPVGMLSQKASANDVSVIEAIESYLLHSKAMTSDDFRSFRPGICNRLDRNTSGIMVAGKTIAGLQTMNHAFAERLLHKYYLCPVHGIVENEILLDGYIEKDEKKNKSRIYDTPGKDRQPIKTRIKPIEYGKDATLLEVELITGKSHQIRAHLSGIGHPLFGDFKYDNSPKNKRLREKFNLRNQLLHAYKLVIPDMEGKLSYLSNKTFEAPVPEKFKKVWEATKA